MTSPTFLTEITCIWGCRGSGKTTLAKQLAAKARPPQLIFIDPIAADGVDVAGMVEAINAGQAGIVVNTQQKAQQIGAILAAFQLSTKARPLYLIADEAPSYLDRQSDALNKVVFQGRHAAFGMCLIGQRPAALDAQMRSQAASTYWLRLNDARDIQTAAQSIGQERARTLPDMAPGQFIKHPE